MGFQPGLTHEADEMFGILGALAAGRIGAAHIAQPAQAVERLLQPSRQPRLPAVVLAVVEQGGTHAPQHHLQVGLGKLERVQLAGGFAADVGDHDIGPVLHAETGGLHAAAQVHFLKVEKEGGVEEAGFEESLAAQDEKRAGNPVRLRRLMGAGPGAVGAPKMRERGKRAGDFR